VPEHKATVELVVPKREPSVWAGKISKECFAAKVNPVAFTVTESRVFRVIEK